MSERLLQRRPLAPWLALLCFASGCSEPADTELARFDGGELGVAQLEEAVQRLPAAQRTPPPGIEPAEWLGSRLGDLAIEQALLDRARREGLAERPGLRLRASLLAAQEVGRDFVRQQCPIPEISEDELRQLYARQVPQQEQQWILLRHIYKRHSPAATVDERNAVRAAAAAVLDQLQAGASFIELARTDSDSQTAGDGGLLGRISRQAPLHPEVLSTAWALEDGEMSGIVPTDNGFHILLREESGTQEPPSFEDAVEELRERRSQAQRSACGQEIIRQEAELTEVSVERQGSTFEPSLSAQIGEEHFDAEQLSSLAGDPGTKVPAQTLMTTTQNLVQSKLLVAAAQRADPTVTDRLREAEAQHLERILLDRQWRLELRRVVDSYEEDRLREYYEDHSYLFHTDLEVEVGLIVVAEQGRTRKEIWEQTLDLASRARAGEAFVDLARQYSSGPNAEEGGQLGARSVDELRSAFGTALASAATELEPGETSEPIALGPGGPPAYALVQVTARREPRPRPYEEARSQVVEAMAGARARVLASEVREQLLTDIDFELNEPAVAAYLERLTGGAQRLDR